MEAIILSKEQYQELVKRIDDISVRLFSNTPSSEKFIDNDEFLLLMKICKRTAQNWRDEGKISFSQVGNKIYYKLTDVEELLKQHYNHAFSPEFKNKLNRTI